MKYILVDWGYIMFRAIFACAEERPFLTVYTALNMMIANIKRVGLEKEDIVIIAVDSPAGSWRKDYDANYKANRKAFRAKYTIDWKSQFSQFNRTIENLEQSTPFHTVCLERLEADDIIAYACRKFKEHKCVIISSDADYDQLYAYGNVIVFSPMSKRYKEVKDPYKVIQDKVKKEASDNLVSPILSVRDFERRHTIVNLLKLPKEVDEKIEEAINLLPDKEWEIDFLKPMSLHKRFLGIYDKDSVVSENKKRRKKKKKEKKV